MAFGYTFTLPTITGSHTNFPVVFKNADFPSAAIGTSGDALANGGGDLRAYTDSAKGTQLSVDVVKFVTGASPSVVVWIKIPTAATSNTIYVEADAVATTQPAVGASFGRDSVWTDYEAVLHLRESGNGTAGEFVDSTGNGNDGQLTTGSSISTVTTAHPFGDEWPDFLTNEAITLASSTTLINNTAFTLSCWVNVDTSSNIDGLFGNRNSANDTNWAQLQSSERIFTKGATTENLADSGSRATATTILVTATQDTSDLRLYSDATNIATDTSVTSGESISSDQNFWIGTYYDDSGSRRLDGRTCEMRVRQSVLSGDWITLEEDNQSASVAWGTVGSWAEATGANTLTADSGTYNYNGTAAGLVAARILAADSGSYAYTGTSVDLNLGRSLAADSGAYTYTGTAATLTFTSAGAFILAADSGAYVYSGTSAGLIADRLLTAVSGSYTYSGTAIDLTHGFTLAASTGAYVYSGTAVGFVKQSVLGAASGSYVYNGTNASLTFTPIPADIPVAGGVTVSGMFGTGATLSSSFGTGATVKGSL